MKNKLTAISHRIRFASVISCFLSFFIAFFLFSPLYTYAFEWSSAALLSLTEEYNDNIYQNRSNKDDFITVVTPGVRTKLDWQRVNISAFYNLGYSFYKNHSEHDGFRHSANVTGSWQTGKFTKLSAGDTFTRSEDISELSADETGTNRRKGSYSNTAFVGFDHIFAENSSISMRYAYGVRDYDDNASDDNKSHSVDFSTTYFFDRYLGLSGDVKYTKGLYEKSQDFDELKTSFSVLRNITRHIQVNATYSHTFMSWEEGNKENDYQVYHPSAGIRYSFDEGSYMGVNLGYFVQDIESRSNKSGMTVDGNIGRAWKLRTGSFSLNANSGYENSQLSSENLGFNVYYGVQSRLIYGFTRNISSTFYLSYKNVDYVNPRAGEKERKDDYYQAGCSLDWQIKKWVTTGIEYSYRNLDSNISINDYKVNRVMLRVVLSSMFGRSPDSGGGPMMADL